MKKALITGVTGQDGSYLAELLLSKGYEVHGVKRRSSLFNTDRIDHLYQDPHERERRFHLHYGDMTDTASLVCVIQRVQPDEIYNLAAQSHVAVSFEEPEYTANTDGLGTLRILEAIRILGMDKTARFYQASTSELFGLVRETPQTETTPFYPRSPYAAAKLYAYWITVNYREAYGISGAGRDICDPQNHSRIVAHQGGVAGIALHWQPRCAPRLGTRTRLRGDAMADAATGKARGFCHRHGRTAQRARIHRRCRRKTGG